MPEKEKFELSSGSRASFLTRHLSLDGISSEQLKNCFGEPNGDFSHEKIGHEWIFEGKNKVIVVIYDLIHQKNPNTLWYIDSTKKEVALEFAKWIQSKIKQIS